LFSDDDADDHRQEDAAGEADNSDFDFTPFQTGDTHRFRFILVKFSLISFKKL
jgi:hypothetical protein